jgi:hypothetical protein
MREDSRTAFRSEAARSLGRRELLLAGGGLWAGYGAEGAEAPPEIIDLAGAQFTEITAINDRREVAGYAFVGGRNVSFVGGAGRSAREMVAMPRFLQHTAFGLNNRGDLVGMGVLFLEQQPVRMAFIRRGQEVEPFRMGDSRATAACGINDRGDVVGIYGESEAGIRSFLLPAGALRPQPLDVPGASRTRAHDINNAGVVVGEYTEGGVTRGFLQRAGKTERFEVEGATSTHPYGINARGDVVGYTKTGSTVRGFVRSAAGVVTAFAIPGCEETKLAAINSRGDLAGTIYRREAGHVQGFVLLADGGKPAR